MPPFAVTTGWGPREKSLVGAGLYAPYYEADGKMGGGDVCICVGSRGAGYTRQQLQFVGVTVLHFQDVLKILKLKNVSLTEKKINRSRNFILDIFFYVRKHNCV